MSLLSTNPKYSGINRSTDLPCQGSLNVFNEGLCFPFDASVAFNHFFYSLFNQDEVELMFRWIAFSRASLIAKHLTTNNSCTVSLNDPTQIFFPTLESATIVYPSQFSVFAPHPFYKYYAPSWFPLHILWCFSFLLRLARLNFNFRSWKAVVYL